LNSIGASKKCSTQTAQNSIVFVPAYFLKKEFDHAELVKKFLEK